MNQAARATERPAGQRMTVAQLRHDIRNHLNTIKLSSALLHRRHADSLSKQSLCEIDSAVDGIAELVTQFLGDADAPGLLAPGGD